MVIVKVPCFKFSSREVNICGITNCYQMDCDLLNSLVGMRENRNKMNYSTDIFVRLSKECVSYHRNGKSMSTTCNIVQIGPNSKICFSAK